MAYMDGMHYPFSTPLHKTSEDVRIKSSIKSVVLGVFQYILFRYRGTLFRLEVKKRVWGTTHLHAMRAQGASPVSKACVVK